MIDGPCLAASRYPYEFEAGWFGSVLVLVAGYSETGYLVVEGDAPDEATLLAAGIERATGLVATIDEDAYNVYVVLSARTLNRQLFIVGRANAPIAEARLKRAGANRIVSPYTMAGHRIAELAVRPAVSDYIDAALSRAWVLSAARNSPCEVDSRSA